MAARKSGIPPNQCAPAIVCIIVVIVIGVVFLNTGILDDIDPAFVVVFIFVFVFACAGASSQNAKKRQALAAAQGTSTPQPQVQPYYQPQPQQQAPAQPTVINKETIIIKEIVKVKCSYCGALVESTQSFCHNCGASM